MIETRTLLTILAMAGVTFFTRVIGYLALRNRTLGPQVMTVLHSAPGCVLIAVIAPAFVSGKPADMIALGVTLVAATRLPMLAVIAAGAASAALLRAILI